MQYPIPVVDGQPRLTKTCVRWASRSSADLCISPVAYGSAEGLMAPVYNEWANVLYSEMHPIGDGWADGDVPRCTGVGRRCMAGSMARTVK